MDYCNGAVMVAYNVIDAVNEDVHSVHLMQRILVRKLSVINVQKD